MLVAIGVGIGGIVSMITGGAHGSERIVIVQQPSTKMVVSKTTAETKSFDDELEELEL